MGEGRAGEEAENGDMVLASLFLCFFVLALSVG
jgi:hypothetical protein